MRLSPEHWPYRVLRLEIDTILSHPTAGNSRPLQMLRTNGEAPCPLVVQVRVALAQNGPTQMPCFGQFGFPLRLMLGNRIAEWG
jgi:hypothetical protein